MVRGPACVTDPSKDNSITPQPIDSPLLGIFIIITTAQPWEVLPLCFESLKIVFSQETATELRVKEKFLKPLLFL